MSLLILVLCAGCADLTDVPPPPVQLSALQGTLAAVDGDDGFTVTEARTRLVRAVSPSALITLHLPDIGSTVRRFRKTSLYEFFTSKQFSQAFGPLTASFSVGDLSTKGVGGAQAEQMLDTFSGEVVVSLEDLSFDDAGKPESARVLAGVTVAGSLRKAEQLLETISMLAAANPGNKVEKGSVGGTPFTRVVTAKPQDLVVELALHRDAMIVGVGRETVTEALARLQDPDSKNLANEPEFRRAMELCGDPRDALRIHVDLQNILTRFSATLPTEALDVLKVFGLDQFKALTTVARLEGKDIVVSTFLDSPGGKDFLTSLLAGQPVDRQFLSRIPADARGFSIFAIDGQKVLDHLREKLRPDHRKELEAGLESMRRKGFDLERDVLRVFGPRCALVTLPTGRREAEGVDAIWNYLLGSSLIVDVRNPIRAQRTLGKLPQEDDHVRRREVEVYGTKVVSYRFDMEQVPDEFSPSYAYVDDFLVIGLCEDTVHRMLKPRSPETAQRFREMFTDVPDTVTCISYEDSRRGLGLIATAFVEGLRTGLTRAGHPPIAVDTVSFEEITARWNTTLSYTVADNKGIFMHSRGPTAGFGGSGGVSGLLILGSVAIPNFTIARQKANEAAALRTLRQLRNAQAAFRANVVRDGDRDGEGEFAFIVELLGKRRPGDSKARLRTPLITDLALGPGRTCASKGYRFRVYLPAEDGTPIGGHESVERIRQVDGDLAEAVMVVVAWPESRPATGHRSFILDATGKIYACETGPYSGAKAPPPDALCSQKGNLASEPVREDEAVYGGHRWVKVRE